MLKMVGDAREQAVRREMPRDRHRLHGNARNDDRFPGEHPVDRFPCHTLRVQTVQREPHAGYLVEFGVDRPRTECTHLDRAVSVPQLLAQRLRQTEHIVFGRVVGRHERAGQEAGRRGDIQNISVAALREILHRELGQNVHRTDIRVDHAQLLVQIGVQKLAEQAKACIIYHDLEIVAAHRTVQQAAFLLVAHIRRDHMAHSRQLGRKLTQTLLAPRTQHQLAAALSERKTGDELDVLGPLGHGFDVGALGSAPVFIGGGIGVPPMLGCVREAVKQGAKPAAILGFRNQGAVILEGDFRDECETFVTTDDGSYARHGFVTDVLKEQIASASGVAACGPKPMLKAIAAIAKEAGVPCQVSMEERMGCGIGACLVCACALKAKDGETRYGHVCKDGPVFNAEEVEW